MSSGLASEREYSVGLFLIRSRNRWTLSPCTSTRVPSVRSFMESRDRRLAARLQEGADADRLVLPNDQALKPLSDFLARTGLGLSPEQAVGWMTLAGVLLASVLFFLRPDWWIGLIGLIVGCAGVWITFLVSRFRFLVEYLMHQLVSLFDHAHDKGTLNMPYIIHLA